MEWAISKRFDGLGWGMGIALTVFLALVASWLARFPVLQMIGALSLALLLGIAWRSLFGLPSRLADGVAFSAKTLLRWGIVLMGARLNYHLVLTVGPRILLVDLLIVVLGILGIAWLSKRAGLPRELGLLIAVGSSICGASAVAAAAPIAEADEETTTLAVALMGLLGTLGVFYYLFLGPHLGFTNQGLGILTGSTLQEVAQVMAAAFAWGPESGDLATLVKLTRVALLAPALLALGAWLNRKKQKKQKRNGWSFDWKEPPLPYFVLGFLLMGGINSLGWLASWQGWFTQASILLMAFAMGGMGLRIDLARVRSTGRAAILVGGTGFLGLSLLAYLLIRVLGIR